MRLRTMYQKAPRVRCISKHTTWLSRLRNNTKDSTQHSHRTASSGLLPHAHDEGGSHVDLGGDGAGAWNAAFFARTQEGLVGGRASDGIRTLAARDLAVDRSSGHTCLARAARDSVTPRGPGWSRQVNQRHPAPPNTVYLDTFDVGSGVGAGAAPRIGAKLAEPLSLFCHPKLRRGDSLAELQSDLPVAALHHGVHLVRPMPETHRGDAPALVYRVDKLVNGRHWRSIYREQRGFVR